jgi:hypothetical protein
VRGFRPRPDPAKCRSIPRVVAPGALAHVAKSSEIMTASTCSAL